MFCAAGWFSMGLALGFATAPVVARADEDELVLMREPTSFMQVADAFDEHDAFDVDISIGYLRTWESGRIQREENGPGAADGRMSRNWQDVADYSRELNQLVFGLDVGIYRDLAAYARLPLVLSDARSLRAVGSAHLIDDRSTMPTPLFELSEGGFRSPTRSGVDWLAVGLAWSVLNQFRDAHVPTWVWMIEGRFNLGEPMHACKVASGEIACTGGGRDPGMSGVHQLASTDGRSIHGRHGDHSVGRSTALAAVLDRHAVHGRLRVGGARLLASLRCARILIESISHCADV